MADEVGSDRVSARRFHEAPGVSDWRVLFWGAYVHYTAHSLEHAIELVNSIGRAATRLGHEPDVDVRPDGVTVRTASRPDGALSALDIALAQTISRTAQDAGYRADPSRLAVIGIAVAQDRGIDVRPLWLALTGYRPIGDDDAMDRSRRGPHPWFHELSPPKPGRGRTHVDISLPADVAPARIEAALAAGGRLVRAEPNASWTLASPDNHGVDVAIWPDTEDLDSP